MRLTCAARTRAPRFGASTSAAPSLIPASTPSITGDEVAQLTRPQRGRVPLPNSPKVFALAYQQVRYVGEPVVGIAAIDRATAEDAADLD